MAQIATGQNWLGMARMGATITNTVLDDREGTFTLTRRSRATTFLGGTWFVEGETNSFGRALVVGSESVRSFDIVTEGPTWMDHWAAQQA